jgi:hypothetical protein
MLVKEFLFCRQHGQRMEFLPEDAHQPFVTQILPLRVEIFTGIPGHILLEPPKQKIVVTTAIAS